jgi:hypothetical protein
MMMHGTMNVKKLALSSVCLAIPALSVSLCSVTDT